MKQPQPFELKLVGGGALGDTGDYDDGHYEITNGKLSLYTSDCDESDESEDHQFEALVNALNATKAKFWTSDGDKAYGLELERNHYKEEIERLEKLKSTIAQKLLEIKKAIVRHDYDEAYHHLYSIADPDFASWEPWQKLENIANGSNEPWPESNKSTK